MKKVYYKGFNSKLQCDPTDKKPFQYEVGKTYEEPEAIIKEKGFHACENPLDVFGFYSPATSRYCEVELEDIADSNSTVTVAKKITIKKELSLNEFIQAAANFNLDKADGENVHSTNTGDWSAATNTGYQSVATVEGTESIAIAVGIEGKAKGAKGCYLVLAEWENDGLNWHRTKVKSVLVDGEIIKADTFYMLKDGEFVEVE